MNFITFQLVTPERTVLSQELVSLSCPTTMGEITILPGHVPLVASLATGELHAKTADNQDSYIFVSGGFVQINPNSQVIVLADSAEHHYEIDEQQTEEAKQRAQKELAEGKLSSTEYAQATAALERSLTKLNIAKKHAHRRNPLSAKGVLNGNGTASNEP
jgi:F-type H+-transporting ATPase subunit epsilon